MSFNLPAAHWSSRDILDISTLVHVVVHANKEQIVRLVPRGMIIRVVRPSETMAMNGTFAIAIVFRETYEAIIRVEACGCVALFHVNEAHVGIIGDILIDTVLIVGFGAVSIGIVGLAILGPAAHGSVGGTRGQAVRVHDA